MAMWDGFLDGPGRTTALRAVLECLGETPTCEALIARLAAAARTASLSDDSLLAHYANPADDRDEWTLVLRPPFLGRVADDVPASLARLASTINGIEIVGPAQPWHWFGLDEDGALASITGAELVVPIQHLGEWIAFHPDTVTVHGEPALCRFDPAAGMLASPFTLELGMPATLLRLLVLALLGDRSVPWTA